MQQSDMELQAIREKLQSLQAEPPAAETLSLPWSEQADQSGNEYEQKSAQEIAIEALKQRSRGGEAAVRAEHLIAQELYRLEVQAHLINEHSQKQAESILALKRSAQQASIGLKRQGIQHHPQLAIITQFLERYPSAAVPHIERDSEGYFTLSYATVDFQQAQHDAIDTAQALRDRSQPLSKLPASELTTSESALQDALFSEPISSTPHSSLKEGYEHNMSSAFSHRSRRNRLQKSVGNTIDKVLYLFERNKKRKRKLAGFDSQSSDTDNSYSFARATGAVGREAIEEGLIESAGTEGTGTEGTGTESADEGDAQFSWLDGTIWFSGAAIARIVVQAIAAQYPIIQTLFAIGIASVIIFALYKVILARSNNYSLIYRLCIAMVGLLVTGLYQ